jgi:AraC family transcriptional regulator
MSRPFRDELGIAMDKPKRELICGQTGVVTDEAGAPVLRLPPGWGGLPLGLFAIPAHEQRGPECTIAPILLLATHGGGRRWYRYSNRRTIELSTAPGMIELYARDYDYEGARWDGDAGQCVGVTLSPQVINRLVPDAPDFNLKTAHEVFDPKVQWLVQELFDEARRGAPAGVLYAEGLSCALIARLTEHYGAQGAAEPPSGHLSASARRSVLEYIDAHLAHDLSLADLAHTAGMSAWHFARCFKASLGISPHRYVRHCRLGAATRMLTSSPLPIAEIALTVGFSSQSHFTQAFREHTGMTPAAARLSRQLSY